MKIFNSFFLSVDLNNNNFDSLSDPRTSLFTYTS